MQLPEVAHAEGETAGDPTDVAETGRATAGVDLDPAVACAGALTDVEAAVGELPQAVVTPPRDERQSGADPGVPGGDVGGGTPGHLRLSYRRAGVTAQAGDPVDGLSEDAVTVAGEPDVPVVRLAGHRHLEADAETADEVLALVAVEDERVHHPDPVTAGVEIKPDGEGQPLPQGPVGPVATLYPYHRAHRTALFDGHRTDLGGEPLLPDGCRLAVFRGVLAQAHQCALRGDGAVAAGDRGDQHASAAGDPAADDAGVHLDRPGGLGDPERCRGRGRCAGAEQVLLGRRQVGADGVGGPLHGAVWPEPGRPGLDRHGLIVGGGQGEFLPADECAAWPRHAPGRADQGRRRASVEPTQRYVEGRRRGGLARGSGGPRRLGSRPTGRGKLARRSGDRGTNQETAAVKLGHGALHFRGADAHGTGGWKRFLRATREPATLMGVNNLDGSVRTAGQGIEHSGALI